MLPAREDEIEEGYPYRPLPVIREVDGKLYNFDAPGACPTCRWSYAGGEHLKCKLNLNGTPYCKTINKTSDCEKWHPKPVTNPLRRASFVTTLGLAVYGLIDILLWIFF